MAARSTAVACGLFNPNRLLEAFQSLNGFLCQRERLSLVERTAQTWTLNGLKSLMTCLGLKEWIQDGIRQARFPAELGVSR